MSKVFEFSGDTDFLPSGFLHAVPKESNLHLSLGRHVDVYFPRKKSRINAPFVLFAEQKPQTSMEVLPDECLYEVFKRISGGEERSACACVSKRWLMLLSSIPRDEIFPARTTNSSVQFGISSVSHKAVEPSIPKEKSDTHTVDSYGNTFDDTDEYGLTDSDGFLSRCLEGKKATDVRLASISIGCGSRGGLGKLSIRGNSSTRGLSNLGLKAIANGCPSLRSLSLWNVSSFGDEGLCEISNGAGAPLLEKLDISHCPAITDKGLNSIAMNCVNLMSVTIESCANIGNESLKSLGFYCPNLKHISVKNCPLVGDQGISNLFTSAGNVLTKAKFQTLGISDVSLAVIGHYGMALTDMQLVDLQNVNDRGFWVMGKGQGLQKLKALTVAACRGISDSGIEALGNGCPDLKMFVLRKCILISDAGLVKFAKAAVSLESLQLNECHRITQFGAFGILANSGGNLKALSVENCLGIRDLNLVCTVAPPNRHSLQSLTIRNCHGFGVAGLAVFAKMCPQLARIDFTGLEGITDAGLVPLVRNLKSGLKSINLKGCVNLTDATVAAITKLHGETIELLNLDGCKYLTDASLSAISTHCSVLSDLDVSNCGVSDSGIAALASAEQLSLSVLSIAGCSLVSDKSIPLLGMLGKSLVGLSIQHCLGISVSAIDLLLEKLSRCDVLF